MADYLNTVRRWIEDYTYSERFICPYCDEMVRADNEEIIFYHFCPHCGNHLMAPKEDYD